MAGLKRIYKKLMRVPNDVQLYELVAARRVGSDFAITCRGKTDGAGAQANACITGMAFAQAMGIGYVHTPFQSIQHAVGDKAAWTARWEGFFGLGQGETIVASDHAAYGLKHFLDNSALWKNHGSTVAAAHFEGVCNQHTDFYTAIIPRLREKYAVSDKSGIALDRGDEQVAVAVHIRRGDVSKDDAVTGGRFSDDAHLVQKIREIRQVMDSLGLTARINVYSQGLAEDFADFAELGCHLQINKDAFETFHNLVKSDVLVTAKSAFSFVAGLLSEGVKIYEPFAKQPPADWLVSEIDQPIDKARFAEKIRALKARQIDPVM
jgi:hypothetical protein